jgi:hypothetical protein
MSLRETLKRRYFISGRANCYACGVPVAADGGWDVAHILAAACGGGNGPENLRVTCQYCNRSCGKEHLFDYMIRNRMYARDDPIFSAHARISTTVPITPRILEPRHIRAHVAGFDVPVGIIAAATGCGKTSLAIELVCKHIRGRILLWITQMSTVVDSQFTRANVLGWKESGIMPPETFVLFGSHLSSLTEFPPTCIVACTHARMRKHHGKITSDPRFVGFVVDECHDEINGPETLQILRDLAPRSHVRVGITATPRRNPRVDPIFAPRPIDAATGEARYLLEYNIFEALRDGYVRWPRCEFARIDAASAHGDTSPGDCRGVGNLETLRRYITDIVSRAHTRKGIIWCDSVESASFLHGELRKWFDFPVLLDHSKYLTGHSVKTAAIFREAPRDCIMVACEKYRAGVDMRGLSFGIVCGKSRVGITTIIQCIGRLTRLEPFGAIFAELMVTESADEYRADMRRRILDFYESFSRLKPVVLKCPRGAFEFKFVGSECGVTFNLLDSLELCELLKFTADEMTELLRTRYGFKVDTEYLRGYFERVGVTSVRDVERHLEGYGDAVESEVARWWSIVRYFATPPDWGTILGLCGDYYATAEEARRAVYGLMRSRTIPISGQISDIYTVACTHDKKLPPDPLGMYRLTSMREIINVDY